MRPLEHEDVALADGLARVLAEDVTSTIDVPPFDSSAMDGYALASGPGARLEVIDEARAGRPAATAVRPGAAIRISTGAAVPAGADAVIPVEQTKQANGGRVEVEATDPGVNVRRAGEDIRTGAVVLRRGMRLGAAELGVAAAVGRATLRCARKPRVALLVTGDELVPPGEPLGPGQIHSSNEFALTAQILLSGAELVARASVPDSAAGTREALAAAVVGADVVIVSGGVSVGPHDHVKGALRDLGVEERFWGVSLRPGKPTWFGTRARLLAFGLPGNPVSAMVTFALFARPALAALQGGDPVARRLTAILDEPIARNPRREQAVRVHLAQTAEGLKARSTGEQGSHMLTSMLGADGLAMIEPGSGDLPAGASVDVELL